MGETQHVFATTDAESGPQDKDIRFEQFSKKDVAEFEQRLLDASESCPRNGTENGSIFANTKDKEPHNQREAVIRPQQAGKIDFKSLHNRSKFPSSDGPWGPVKGSPQSPTGKSRVKDKGRKSGKGERVHQQLYRLTINNARPSPTIGIAYPQQKITPPKKVDVGRGPVSGSYRFHVPSIPEREAELQQEEVGFARCFPEASSSHISSNYTSPTAAARPNHGGKVVPPVGVARESLGPSRQFPYVELQGEGGHGPWPLPDKSLPGANHGLFASSNPEGSKLSANGLGPLTLQYPFQSVHSSALDPFQGEAHPQDYVDVSLATSQASHGAFSFRASSRDWKEEAQGNGSYDNAALEARTYGLAPQPAPFLPPQSQGHLPCYKGRNELSTDHNHGAISPSGAINHTPSPFHENQAVFPHGLHVSSVPKPIGKRQSLSKDSVASQKMLDAGSSLRRTVPPISLPQVHFPNKAYRDPPASSVGPISVPFEKSPPTTVQAHPRLLQAWEGGKRPSSPLESSSAPFPSPVGKQLSFGGQLGPEQRQHLKKNWQHPHLTSAGPSQNRIELSRKLASQKLPFPLGGPEWEGVLTVQKSSAGYPNKRLLEGAIIQRHDLGPQNSCLEGVPDAESSPACGPSRNKARFFSMGQVAPSAPPHLPSNPALALPPSAMGASPSNSPLPSPAPNPAASSTCSSLSPLSNSPSSHSLEDSVTLAASPFFHHQCHPRDAKKPFHPLETLSASSIHYQVSDPIKAFHLSPDGPKEELLGTSISADSHFHKPNTEVSKGCLVGLETELPPPPYASHHLLASSLSSASLDQLDVFLTCKQCDQNFSNLSSFLEHRQFCSCHAALQGQTKDASQGAEGRRPRHHPPLDSMMKHPQTGLGLLLPPDPHLQLLPLSKPVDFLIDGEGKGEAKEEPLKGNPLSSLAANPLPLSASDLEMDDAKLDSLITEALNGLEYQSDNPEIDSSFIDVFADEELSSVKVANGGTPCKAKEGLASGKKAKLVGAEEGVKSASCYSAHPSGDLGKSRTSGKQQAPKERGAGWFQDPGDERPGKQKSPPELVRTQVVDPATWDGTRVDAGPQLRVGRRNCCAPVLTAKQVPEMQPSKHADRSSSPGSRLRATATLMPAGDAKPSAKDVKKRKPRSGTWSKELIHKIVQQKNQLHKLHPKSSKVAPLSLLADRLLPEKKDSRFGEYEYISESDEERVECAKRHCRRKLRSRLSGKLRSSFSRRCQGRAGREKEKEPAWRRGQRRDREGATRAPSMEGARKSSCLARGRRRGGSSSASSRQSTSVSSEAGSSPQSTERVDSDTEKESESRRRRRRRRKALPSPSRAASQLRGLLTLPGTGKVGRNHPAASGTSGEPGLALVSAKMPPAGFGASRRSAPKASPVGCGNGSDASPPARGRQRHHEGMLGKSPAVPYCADDSGEGSGSPGHDSGGPKAAPKEPEACALGLNPRWHQFTAYNGETLRYHTEGLVGPSPESHHSIPCKESPCCEKGGARDPREPKEFTTPIGCSSDSPIGLGVIEERPDALISATETFYDCKEFSDSCEPSGLFSGPPGLDTSHRDHVYLCHGGAAVGPFKPKHPELPSYEADHEPSKVSSPLSFDSSSVFGELPVAEFDASLYDGVTSSKANYVAFACASSPLLGKMTPFDQHYSSFLQVKDWNLMAEASPVLPDDIAPFHSLSAEKPLAKRFSGEISQMPLPLPERMADYTVPFINSMSDDELEIKRLVTELESQLQTSKLRPETPHEHRPAKPHTGVAGKEASSHFPSLTLDQECDEKGLFVMEGEFENANLLAAKSCVCENSVSEKTLLQTLGSKYVSHQETWSCPRSFSPIHGTMHTPSTADLMLVGPFSPKEAHDKFCENLKDIEISGEDNFRELRDESARIILPDPCLSDISDNLEVPSYAEHLLQSPEDPLFPKTLEEAELNIPEALPPRPIAFPELHQEAKKIDGTTELDPYNHLPPSLKPEFGLQEAGVQESEGNVTSRTENIKDLKEGPIHKARSPEKLDSVTPFPRDEDGPLCTEKAEEVEGRAASQSPASHDKAGDGGKVLFDALTFPKEIPREASQEKTVDPLQQLQLFVARTVKSNEEDLLIPCFPVLQSVPHLPTGVQPELEEEALDRLQSTDVQKEGSVGEELGSMAEGSDAAVLFREPDKDGEHLGEKVSYASEPLQGPDRHSVVTEQQPSQDACSEVGDMNMCADGPSLEHSDLSTLSSSVATSLLRQERQQGCRLTGEVEEGRQRATLAFRPCRQSPLSPGSLEKEVSGHALPAVLRTHVAGCAAWGDTCCEEEGLCAATARQSEERMEPLRQSPHNLPLAPSHPPGNQYQGRCLLHPTDGFCSGSSPVLAAACGLAKQAWRHAEGSQDGSPLEGGFADRKHVPEKNTGIAASPDLGAPPSEEACCVGAAEVPPILLGVHRPSTEARKTSARDPSQSPSEHKEWKELPLLPPAAQPCDAASPLPPDRTGNMWQRLAEEASHDSAGSQKDAPASSSCSNGPAVPLAEMEGHLLLQTGSCRSPSLVPLQREGLSSGHPKSPGHEGSNGCSVQPGGPSSQPSSPQGALLGSPSPGAGATPLGNAKTNQYVKATPTLQGGKEGETCAQKGCEDHTQPEVCDKGVGTGDVAPAVGLAEAADPGEVNFGTAQFLETTERGPQSASQGIRDSELDNQVSEQQAGVERPSSRMEQEEKKSGNVLRDDSEMGQREEKEGKGLQDTTCEICSIPFQSKTGLMRHRAAKHLKSKGGAQFLDSGSAPLEKSLKTSKAASRKNRKGFTQESMHSSRVAKAAVEQPFRKSSRSQRKEPSAEIQEVVSRVLGDLRVISLDITQEFQSPDGLGKERKTKSESSQAARLDESAVGSQKEANMGGRGREAGIAKADGFARKQVKRKVRKGRGGPKQNKVAVPPRLEKESRELGSPQIPSTAKLLLSTAFKSSSAFPEGQADVPSPSPPHPPTAQEPERDAEKIPSTEEAAGPQLLRDAGACKEQAGHPQPEGKLEAQETWLSRAMKPAEEDLSNTGEEQCGDQRVKAPETVEVASRGSPLSPVISTLRPNRRQPSCDAGAERRDVPEILSGKATEKASGPVDAEPWKAEEPHPQKESCNEGATQPDLPGLFDDDDSTFSQLFPRNDHFARRKCTRVYGKRAKKPKPVAEASCRPEGAVGLFTIRMASDLGETSSFCVTQEDPCEYETISIDDALMLNMCHGSRAMVSDVSPGSARNGALQPEARRREDMTDPTDDGTFDPKEDADFGFQEPKSHPESLPSLSNWESLEKAEDIPAGRALLDPSVELTKGHSAEEASPEPPDLQEESYDPAMNEDRGSPQFHTIDLELLNPKFEMRDVHFYSVREDRLSPPDESPLDFKPVSLGRATKNKLEEGKSGKPRSDVTLKTKEKQYKCKVCFQWFLTLGELDFHKLTHNPSPPPTCYMCVQRKFSSREQLRDHLKEKHAKNKAGLWTCGMCLKEISDVWMYNEHLREHATQFARKGQAQKSVLGLPGCFGEDDAAVTHFLNSIMCRKPSKPPSKPPEAGSKVAASQESKSPRGSLGQEVKVGKDLSEHPVRSKPPAASPKVSAVLAPDPAPKVEGAQKPAAMHPECKDPSRDCHHCGKQFPKPFKLQRHLVVHSLQKIYLCHRCPMFYQETKELRSHFSQEHGTAEEADIKHTTLYACELCADVMHVIKKSFICSTCNYTFSKKEQYDRHMEKHLVGSSKTFRFRGVMRPSALAKEGEKKVKVEGRPREGTPAAKKRKIAHPRSSLLTQGSPAPVECAQGPQPAGGPLLPPREPAASVSARPPAQASVKTEDLVGGISSLLAGMGKSPFDGLPPASPQAPQDGSSGPELQHIAALSVGQLEKGDSLEKNLPPFLDTHDVVSIDLPGLAHKPPPPHLSQKHKQADVPENGAVSNRVERDASESWLGLRLQEDAWSMTPELSAPGLEAAECKGSPPEIQGSSSPHLHDTASQESGTKLNVSEAAAFSTLPLMDKTSSPAVNWAAKDIPAKKSLAGLAPLENATHPPGSLGSGEEVQKPPALKDKAFSESGASAQDGCPPVGVRELGSGQVKAVNGHLRGEAVGAPLKHGPPDQSTFQDRPIANGLSRLHPKKRKEHKSAHKGSAASRENMEGEGGSRKKRAQGPDATWGDSARGFKRAEGPNGEALALSPRRRNTHCNKLTPKSKVSPASRQIKKVALDHCFQKKMEVRHPNGDLKRKKDIWGSKGLHHLFAKDPSASLPGSLNRHRTVQGAKVSNTHNYRTAESQNNLLSQLFGQKLTSFKIPLRRDTSE